MKKIAFIIIILIMPSKVFSIGTVGVQPLNIDLELQPSKKGEFSIDIYSTSNEDTPVNVLLYDVSQREDGNVDFTDPGKSPFSCAKWIKLQKNDFIVPAGETVTLKGEIYVPKDASGVKIATIMIEPAYEKKEKGITVKLRYAVIIKVKVKGKNIIESGKIENVKINTFHDGIPYIEASLFNNSNVDYKVVGKAVLHESSGKILETIDLTTHYLEEKQKREKKDNNTNKKSNKKTKDADDDGQRVFPGSKVNFYGRISKPLKEGEYIAIVSMKFGKRTITAKEKIAIASDLSKTLKTNENIKYSIKPESIEIKVPKGGARSAFFNIINDWDEKINFKLSLKDIAYTPEGERKIQELGTTEYTLNGIANLNEPDFTLEPKKSKSFRLDIKVPSNFDSGGRYGQIIIETGNSEKKFIDLSIIIPDKFFAHAEITDFLIKENKENKEFEILLKNNSKVHIVPECKVLIMDADENKLAQINLKGDKMLPGLISKLTGSIDKKLKNGKYFALAEIEYGGKEKVTKKIEFNVN